MRLLLYGLVGSACLLIGSIAFLWVAAPTGFVRDQMIAAVEARTGRTLSIEGGSSFTLYPRFGVELGEVALSGPPEMEQMSLVRMRSMKVAVPLLGLLGGDITLEEFVLVDPVFELRTDRGGRSSWSFAAAGEEDGGTGAGLRGSMGGSEASDTAGKAPVAGRGVSTTLLEGLSLGDVRIVNGTLHLTDERSGTSQTLEKIDLALTLERITRPLTASGSLAWNGQALPFTARLKSPKDLLEGRPTAASLDLGAAIAKARFEGELQAMPAVRLDGKLDAGAPSLRALLAWIGAEIPAAKGLETLAVKGDLAYRDGEMALTKATVSLDGWKAAGSLGIATGEPRPRITAELGFDRVDLNVYLPEQAGAAEPAKASGKKARAAGADWSDAPIDLSGLGALDADARLSFGQLIWRDVKLDASVAELKLVDRALKVRFPEIALYGGRGVGSVALDGRRAKPRIESSFTFDDVSALPLLTDAAGFDWIAGSSDISFGFLAVGGSQREMVSGLTGQGRFRFNDGAIVGFNVAKAVRNLQQGKLEGWERDPDEKTDFSELSSTFTVKDGIARNDDLTLVGPLLRASGAGTADLPARTLDYDVKPKLVASLEGQGAGEADLGGLEIPVKISGPWAKPKLKPDLGALAKNPEAALEAVKKLAGKGKGKKVEEAIGGLLGGSDSKGLSKKLKSLFGGGEEETGSPP